MGTVHKLLRARGKQAAIALANQNIADRALFIEDVDDRQGRLTGETAKLSEGFFEQVKRHPMPIEERAIKAISDNSQAIDCYLWLAGRLPLLAALKGLFGGGMKGRFHFNPSFLRSLPLATAYPGQRSRRWQRTFC